MSRQWAEGVSRVHQTGIILTEVRFKRLLAIIALKCSSHCFGSASFCVVMVPVEMRSLSDQILRAWSVQGLGLGTLSTYEAMEMMENEDIGHVASSLLRDPLDHALLDTKFLRSLDRNHN